MHFDNTYFRELSGLYEPWLPTRVKAPRWLFRNTDLWQELGIDQPDWEGVDGAAVFAGNAAIQGAEPLAQAYSGHQFGHFSPVLGDGRALLLGEVIDVNGQRRDIAFKGSGRTPFSRRGDGKAAVGPMLREVLVSESMHALGIPTTRALAVVATGEPVYRERTLPGAVLTRVAASHIRVGTFQLFAAHNALPELRRLVDYTIARHDPEWVDHPERIVHFYAAVTRRQAALIAQWMNVGFIHGVMNTDNMAVSGETIDYGPCAFMEAYDPKAVFSSIDEHGRYAYGQQPTMARWNLARLAEALVPALPDIDPDDSARVATATEPFQAVLHDFEGWYKAELLAGQRRKLGLTEQEDAGDQALVTDWLTLLAAGKADFTQAHWHLSTALVGNPEPLRACFQGDTAGLTTWLARWQARLTHAPSDSDQQRQQLRQANPRIIARNHSVEQALAAASERDDLAPFNALLAAVRQPYATHASLDQWAEPAPREATACYRTFCGT
jgi:serine/tyrosine/threonine adenylyltransferase